MLSIKQRKFIVVSGIILSVLILFMEAVFHFNRFSMWSTAAHARSADLEKELQRRNNLIPHISRLVDKYSEFEEKMFKSVTEARELLNRARHPDSATAMEKDVLDKMLPGLVALSEQYPELRATQATQDLMKGFIEAENRIADAKEKFNSTVGAYNQCYVTFPGNVFAKIFCFDKLEYIGSENEVLKAPQIN
ncbi:MAG: LemA family protein [Candidatus Riflebacteria bacterium]|nr:LemA family protein [Candidatus Riflebacteria bacterium]